MSGRLGVDTQRSARGVARSGSLLVLCWEQEPKSSHSFSQFCYKSTGRSPYSTQNAPAPRLLGVERFWSKKGVWSVFGVKIAIFIEKFVIKMKKISRSGFTFEVDIYAKSRHPKRQNVVFTPFLDFCRLYSSPSPALGPALIGGRGGAFKPGTARQNLFTPALPPLSLTSI